MLKNKTLRYLMFALLYFTQGTILSYFTALNALYFLSRGVPLTRIGIFSTIALVPFILKIFLGILSDKVNLFKMGNRKPYILLGLSIQIVCLIIAPFIDPLEGYWGFVALAFILQLGMALYDTCTDGLALDTTPEEESGTIQGFMVGGRAVGVIVTASVVGLLADNVGWIAVFWLLAVLTLLPLPLVLQVKEAEKAASDRFNWAAFAAFRRVDVLLVGVIGLVFFLIIAGANQIVNPFLESEYQISLSTAGYLTTLWGVGVVLGGVVGGYIKTHLGRRATSLIAMAISFLAILALAITPSLVFAWPLDLLFGVAYGTYQTVFFALAMDFTEKKIAASMFAILMAFSNIGQAIGLALSGALADGVGFRNTFIIFALLNFVGLPVVLYVFGRKQQQEAAVVTE